MKKFLYVGTLALVALAGCTRNAPAPVELRGTGYGETRPGIAGSSAYAGSSARGPVTMENNSPPSGYAAPSASGIQAQPLGEPNDPYSQSASRTAQPLPPPTNMSGSTMTGLTPPPSTAPSPIVSETSAGQGSLPPALGGPVASPPPAAVSLPTPASPKDLGSGQFGWPLRGTLLSGYGPKKDGQANDGLNIEAPLGTSVYASKDGTVAYAGNELQSFGNMVLVRHDGGFFTVYAHLDQVLVNKDQPITRGQPVGTVGQSGGVAKPQLHFEIRRGSTPQDPTKYLGS